MRPRNPGRFLHDRLAATTACLLGLALLPAACGGESAQNASSSSGDPSCGGAGGTGAGGGDVTRVEPADDLSPLRLLRRASITLLGVPPTDAQMAELLGKSSVGEQTAYVDAFVDAALEDPPPQANLWA